MTSIAVFAWIVVFKDFVDTVDVSRGGLVVVIVDSTIVVKKVVVDVTHG